MRRVTIAGVIATLALAIIAAPTLAASPKAPSGPPDAVQAFDAGVVCAFAIRLEGWSNERVREGDRIVVTGNSRARVTNLEASRSVMLLTSGRVVISDPGDGTSRLRASGQTLFWFLPQDVNPVGRGGGLFLVTGHARQVLDFTADAVTEFSFRGTVRDICAELG